MFLTVNRNRGSCFPEGLVKDMPPMAVKVKVYLKPPVSGRIFRIKKILPSSFWSSRNMTLVYEKLKGVYPDEYTSRYERRI